MAEQDQVKEISHQKEGLVVLPVYNRYGSINISLKKFFEAYGDKYSVLVIDDGSDDDTSSEIEPFSDLKIIINQEKSGYGNTYQSAIEYALSNGHKKIIFADISQKGYEFTISKITEHLENGYDIVNVSRLNNEEKTKKNKIAEIHMGNQISSKVNDITGFGLTDVFSPFKGFRSEILSKFELTEPDETIIIQAWIQARHFKANIREIFLKEIERDSVMDVDYLENDFEYYYNFMDGELLLYPLS